MDEFVTYTKKMNKLPECCYSIADSMCEIIVLKRGERGYHKTEIPVLDKEMAREIVDLYNEKLGVTRAQEEAMKAGSMFGYTVPLANPEWYNEEGSINITQKAMMDLIAENDSLKHENTQLRKKLDWAFSIM